MCSVAELSRNAVRDKIESIMCAARASDSQAGLLQGANSMSSTSSGLLSASSGLLSSGYGSLDSSTRSLSTSNPNSDAGSPKELHPSNGSDTSDSPQICFDFTKGMCTRGDKCKYSHDIETIIEYNSKEKGICFDHLRNQCHRGVLCRFSHDLSSIAMQCQEFGGMPSSKMRATSICYDFVKGVCSRGSECRYSHDLGMIARTARAGAGQLPLGGTGNAYLDALGAAVNPAMGYPHLAAAAANPALLSSMAMASLGALQGQLAGHQASALAAGLMGNPAAQLAQAAGMGAGGMNGLLGQDMLSAGGSSMALLAAMQAKSMMAARNAAMLSTAAAVAGGGLPDAGLGRAGMMPGRDAALAQLLAQRELARNMAASRVDGLYNRSATGSLPNPAAMPGMGSAYPSTRHSDSGGNSYMGARRPAGAGMPPYVGGVRHSDSGVMPGHAAGPRGGLGLDPFRAPGVPGICRQSKGLDMAGDMGLSMQAPGPIRARGGAAPVADPFELLLKQQALQQAHAAAMLSASAGMDLAAGMDGLRLGGSPPLGMMGPDGMAAVPQGCDGLLEASATTPTQIKAIWDRSC